MQGSASTNAQRFRSSEPARWCTIGRQPSFQFFRKILDKVNKFSPSKTESNLESLQLQRGTRPVQARSMLLNLPVENRFMIWESIVANAPIVLFQKHDHVAYDFLTNNGPSDVQQITPATMDVVKRAELSTRRHTVAKANLLAILQTCQTMYVKMKRIK